MFHNFPKIRPALPKEIDEIYSNYYKSNRDGQTIVSSHTRKIESWMHKKVARDTIGTQHSNKATLEIGAGTLNQLPYETNSQPYDIVEPFTNLYRNSLHLHRIRNIYKDISDVPSEYSYDRITSIAVLEHICNLPEVVSKSGLLLAPNGVFHAAIPSEGTLLWKLGWLMTTGIEFKITYGLDYGLLMKHEHVNTADEIENVLEFFFENIECEVFGLSKRISLYRFYSCSKPIKNNCKEFASI
jgi:hypothetical protein